MIREFFSRLTYPFKISFRPCLSQHANMVKEKVIPVANKSDLYHIWIWIGFSKQSIEAQNLRCLIKQRSYITTIEPHIKTDSVKHVLEKPEDPQHDIYDSKLLTINDN